MRSVLGGLVFDQLSGPSTSCHQKDLLPLHAWQPTVSDIVNRYATGISEAEARSRNAWTLLFIACLKVHYCGGKSWSDLLLCQGPPSESQLRCLWRIWQLSGTLNDLNPGEIAPSSITSELEGKDIDYGGNEVCTARPMTLDQLLPGLPL